MTADERVALVLQADDRASAIVARVRNEVRGLRSEASSGGAVLDSAASGAERLGATDVRLHKAGRAMSSIAFAASQARLGTQGAVRAVGELAGVAADALPAFAGWSGAIAGAVAVAGTLFAIVRDTRDEQERQQRTQQRLADLSLAGVERAYQGIQERRRQAMADLEKQTDGWLAMLRRLPKALTTNDPNVSAFRMMVGDQAGRELERLNADLELITKRRVELRKEDDLRLINLGDQTREMRLQKRLANESLAVKVAEARYDLSTVEAARRQAQIQLRTQNAAVEATFRHRDASGQLVELTREEVRARASLLALNERAYQLTLSEIKAREAIRGADLFNELSDRIEAAKMEAAGASAVAKQRAEIERSNSRELVLTWRLGLEADYRLERERMLLELRREQVAALEREAARANRSYEAETGAMSDDPSERMRSRLAMIDAQKQADIEAGISEVAARRRAELSKRQLYRETFREAMSATQQLSGVLIATKSRELRAIGQAMDGVRRVVLGYEAAEAMILSLKYGAKAIGYAADFQFLQAAQAAAASVEFARVAAVAGSEAAGGAGARAGGGGGGGATSASTFEPRGQTQGNGAVTVVLVTRDPFGRDTIQQTMYAINRSEKLGVPALPPIQIPPTTGLDRVA